MSEAIKHECGLALLRLLKPLEYYREKYGSSFYGIDKMFLLMEKQHNRGQDGAGFASVKMKMKPGERYISRIRSNESLPIQNVFSKINERIGALLKEYPECKTDFDLQKRILPYTGELFLGHVRYGTSGKNNIESVHPFLRQNNWMHRNLIIAGNFNMTNLNELFNTLVKLGQHPKEKVDTVTVMENIGHFLDDAVRKIYKDLKKEGFSKVEASPIIAERLNIAKILKKASKCWDGGYVIGGALGHGDAFVFRDPAGIRPCYYYHDDEIVVVTSERPPIQTAFNITFEDVKTLDPGSAMIVKSNGKVSFKQIIPPTDIRSCSFERIYFSRGNDVEIYRERKNLGRLIFPKIVEKINGDIENTVFSYIPNTSETAFLGTVCAAQKFLSKRRVEKIWANRYNLSESVLSDVMKEEVRIEKIAVKDAKLRTFIVEDNSRDDLVTHVYDVTYGVVRSTDNLVVVDDSIVRGTTLKKSILKMLDRLSPKHIVIVSSAPQIRYPDCYGIDMANLNDLVAFRAAIELHKCQGNHKAVMDEVYSKCKYELSKSDGKVCNAVKAIYEPFTAEQTSDKIAEMLSEDINTKVSIVFQPIENLQKACPDHRGDWYFTGQYPTRGGCKISNKAFVNFYEGVYTRAY